LIAVEKFLTAGLKSVLFLLIQTLAIWRFANTT